MRGARFARYQFSDAAGSGAFRTIGHRAEQGFAQPLP